MAKEVKKIGVIFILAWIFGVLFILGGAVSLTKSVAGGLLSMLGGIIILPPFGDFIKNKFNIHLTGWLRFIIFLILVGFGGSLIPTAEESGSDAIVKLSEQVQKVGETSKEAEKTEPTTSREDTPTKVDVINLSGYGDDVKFVELKKGLAIIDLGHKGGGYFGVWLKDSDGNDLELLANDIGTYFGRKVVKIEYSGTYLLDVSSDNAWAIIIQQS